MARKLVLFLCASLTFASISAHASPQNISAMNLSVTPGEGIALDVSRISPEFTSISITNPGIQVIDVEENFETYQMFTLEGEPVLPVEGNPAVPQVTRFYRIPNTGGVDLVIRNAEYEVQEDVNAYPFFSEETGFQRDARNPAVYGKNEWYPQAIATMSEPLIFRDFRVVTVTLCPVQVNPATGQARIYSNISVDLVANDEPGTNELLNPRRPSGAYARLYRDFIENLDESALDEVTTVPGTYLIITRDHTQINSLVDQIADWKMRKGFAVSVDRRATWSNTQILSAIRTFAQSADPPLEYVCLIGDPQQSQWGLPISGSYDHGYALSTDNDHIEDWGVGRLSASDQAQMQLITAKILNYESNPYMDETDWYTRGFFVGDVAHEIASNYTLMQWGAQQWANHTGIVNNEVASSNNGSNLTTIVPPQFAEGICVFYWRGSWLSQMDASLASACNSGWKLPVCMTVTCGAGNYDWGLGTQESYLVAGTVANPKGGIAGIGTATSGTHAPQNITFAGGLIYSMADQEITHLGTALSAAKVWLTRTWGAGSSAELNFASWNNLMGDPGLSYWTDIPMVLDVTHPATLNVGARQVAVTVLEDQSGEPVQDALVVLWKGDRANPETYVKAYTDVNGEVMLPVTIDTPGDLRLTVSKLNVKPHLFDIPCVTVDQMVSAESAALDDDNGGGTSGNSNGEYNPGEIIDLNLLLENHGSTSTASSVSAVLTCSNPNVTVVNNSSTFPNIAPGAQASGNTPFRIQISPTMQHLESALLQFAVTTNSGVVNSSLEMVCKAGDVEVISHQFVGGNLTPGDTRDLNMTVKNSGVLAMSDVSATLLSLSPFIAVNTPSISLGNIAAGQQVTTAADPFELTAIDLTYPGHQATLQLMIETASGYRDTTQFTITAGTASATDPTGPDAYGYFAYDNGDIEYEFAPAFDYVNISGGLGTDLNLNDSGEKTTIGQLWSTVRTLPFEFTYYGATYNTVTICANGWIAFGDQGWNDNFRNFPMPAMAGADAMLAPFWDDLKTNAANQGVWEYYDAANDRYIVQWKAGAGSSYSTPVDFEVILYNTETYPTFTGDGEIVFQYGTMPANATNLAGVSSEAPGASVGFHNVSASDGLGLAYQNDFASGVNSAVFTSGHAIKVTTESRALFGQIVGRITDARTGEPIEGVEMTLDGFNYFAPTDADGNYHIENVLIGSYTVRAHRVGYNDRTTANITVVLDETETVDMTMLHPEIAFSTPAINVSLPDDEPVTTFQIQNDGNGPLDFGIEIVYTGGGDPVDPWGQIEDIDISGATGDLQVLGCEFVEDHWWVSGGNGQIGNNKLYKFDLEGNYVGSIPQPSVSAFGWYDLAYDGQYLYGSEDGTGTIQGIDPATGTLQASIPSPLNPTRAIAYDPDNDRFWIADYTQDIYEIDDDGEIFSLVTNQGENELAITGLAWNPTDPDGYKLYIFSQNGSAENQTLVSKMHTFSHDIQPLTVLEGEAGDNAGGCAITGGWNSSLLVFGGILQNSGGDRLGIYQVDFNTVWIDVTPTVGTVSASSSREITISFDTSILRNATYQVSLLVSNAVLDTILEMPVTLIVDIPDAADPEGSEVIPTEYALYQNYPNPFNPSTTIRYDLRAAGPTSLVIYNIVGQQVAQLVNEVQQAGSHSIHFDAAALTSGVYFYRLTSGDFVKTSKMVLMK